MAIEYKLSYTAQEIDEKLGKITDVDQTYNSESTNPQSGKAVAEAIENIPNGTITVDKVNQSFFRDGIVCGTTVGDITLHLTQTMPSKQVILSAELTSKTDEITEASTDEIPTAKAVYDLVNSIPSGSGGGSGSQSENYTIYTFLDAYVSWCNGEKFPIAFYGDSTFAGYNTSGKGYTFCDILQNQLRRECGENATIYNAAVSGTRLPQGISSFDANFGVNGIYSDTKMIGIGYGINDRLSYHNYKAYKEGVYRNLETLILKCFERKIQPFLVTSQSTLECGVRTDYVAQYPLRDSNAMNVCANGAKKELAKKYNLPLLDLNVFTELYLANSCVPANTIISDRLHFGNVGHIYEAGYFFNEMVSRVIEITDEDKHIISYSNQNLRSAIPEEQLSYDIADFKLGANYTKDNNTDIKIMDLYLFVKDQPATLVAYKNDGGLTYIKVNNQTYAMSGNETEIGVLDLGLHHLEVYTGESAAVNFNGFKVNYVDVLENIISPDSGSSEGSLVPPEGGEPDIPDVPEEPDIPDEPDTPDDPTAIEGTLFVDTITSTAGKQKQGLSITADTTPLTFIPNYDAENKTTQLSGETITGIVLEYVSTAGTLTISKVDLNEIGTGSLTPTASTTYTIERGENVGINLGNLELGQNETIAIGQVGDTAGIYYVTNNNDVGCKVLVPSMFKENIASKLGFACKVYGVDNKVKLTSISATYTGGDVVTGTALSSLQGINVTATYSDGSTSSVTGYTLSGSITEGNNTITVTYEGLTTTFTVVGFDVADVGTLLVDSITSTAGLSPSKLYMNNGIVPIVFVPNYDAESKTTALSGKTIKKIILPSVSQAGTLTISKVDMTEIGTGSLTPIAPTTYNISSGENVGIVLNDLQLGQNETIAIGQVGDTAGIYFVTGAPTESRIYTDTAFKQNATSTIGFACKVYGD